MAETPLQRPPARAGRRFVGRYRLERLVAHGGMATVWLATDELLRRPVAVKLLHEHLRDPISLERFRGEGKLAAQLSHPNIVAIYDTFSDDGVDGIVLEYVDGTTLRERLDRGTSVPVPEAVAIARSVALALAVAHRRGLIHRDIKPANILLDARGTVKVTDFGIAKLLDATDLTQPGTYVGTAKYLAPEQVTGEPSDGRVDVYSLGVVLYEMLCGEPPFSGDTDAATALARLQLPAPPVQRHRPELPPALAVLIDRMLDRTPARRPTMDEVAGALGTIDATSVAPHVPAGAARRTRRLPTALVAVGVLVLLALVVAGALVAGTDAGRRWVGRDAEPPPSVPIPLDTARLTSYDPEGDDLVEHEELLQFLTDGNDRSVWTTVRYASPDFGGLKKGLGVIVDLGRSTAISELEVRGESTGWDAVVYVADGAPTEIASWGDHVAQRSGIDGSATFTFSPVRGRTVLLWITDLGDAAQVRIGELLLRGPA